MQAKDIPDEDLLRVVRHINTAKRFDLSGTTYEGWALVMEIAECLPDGWPWKVVAAKLRQLDKRGLINGCCCGCRGDFTLTEKGLQLIGINPVETGLTPNPS